MLTRRRIRKLYEHAERAWHAGVSAAFTGKRLSSAFEVAMHCEDAARIAWDAGFDAGVGAKAVASEEGKAYATLPDRIPAGVWAEILAEHLRP